MAHATRFAHPCLQASITAQVDNEAMGRVLIGAGFVLIAAGLFMIGLKHMGLGVGRLPGDLVWRGKRTTVYLPLGTSLLLSVLLSLVLYLLSRMRR